MPKKRSLLVHVSRFNEISLQLEADYLQEILTLNTRQQVRYLMMTLPAYWNTHCETIIVTVIVT